VERPFSQACENNKQAILDALREILRDVSGVLELGSGTGQHARYFAEQLPALTWQTSDVASNLPGIEAWRAGYAGSNLPPTLTIDVTDPVWPAAIPEAIFTANSLHIMPWSSVCSLFDYLSRHAPPGNLLCVYGPFNYGGNYTSDSNARFDQWLGLHHPGGGIRDFEAVSECALNAGYALQADHAMPANNRLLVFRSIGS